MIMWYRIDCFYSEILKEWIGIYMQIETHITKQLHRSYKFDLPYLIDDSYEWMD